MKHAQANPDHSVIRFFNRQIVVVLALNVFLLNSASSFSRDQNYLNSINAEAENLEEIGNSAGSNRNPPTAEEKLETFLQKINSTLYSSSGTNEPSYLKQLETEVQEFKKPRPQQANVQADDKPSQSKALDLQHERNRVIQITEAQRKEMEITLESKIPGVYRIYKKLGLTQRRLVLKEYLESEKISTASKAILRIYGGK